MEELKESSIRVGMGLFLGASWPRCLKGIETGGNAEFHGATTSGKLSRMRAGKLPRKLFDAADVGTGI